MDEAKKQKIVRAVIDKKTPIKDVAAKLFITERQLKLLLKEWGIEIPRRKYTRLPTPERKALMVLYSKYGNTQKVGEHFGVGINTVNKWMKERKVPTRKMKMNEKEKLRFLEEHLNQLDVAL